MDQCGTTPPTCIPVVVNTPPAAPTFTSGPNQVCASDMESYCVNNDPNATTWSWTSPAGNFPDTATNCLNIDWTGLSGGNICVTANNECGPSPQTCFNVAIIDSPTATISGQGEFCTGSGDAIDLTIELTGTAPWTITYSNGGPILVEDNILTSPHIISVTEEGTYVLNTVTDGGICPGTVSGSAEVIENQLPTAALSGSGDICLGSGQQVNLTIDLTGAAPWQVVYENGAGNQSNLNITASPFTLPISQAGAGTITLISVEDDNDCLGTVSGASEVNVFDAPTTTVSTECDATNTEFVVTIVIENGDPNTYSVTPLNGTLTGNVFTSDPIPHGNGYSFIVTDVNNCNPSDVSDNIVVCDCTTAVGVMDDETLETCGDGPITSFAYDDTDQVLDGDDVQMYVLHSGNSASIVAPILAISPTATASYDPATMTYGEVYYLSAAVGNGGGAQGIDLNDPCLQVAQGTPVVFYEIPTATIAGTAEICDGESADLTLNLTGVSPWTVTINGAPVTNIFSSPYIHTVDPDATTDYILTEVSDGNNCTNAATGTETITVNTSPMVINVNEICNGSGTAYTVTFEITGGDPTCYSITPMDGTLNGNVFTSNEIGDGLPYSFEISDCRDCPSVIVEKPLVDCNCLSEAGNMTADDLDVCGSEVAPVNYEGGEFLDADDALCFILHSGNPQSPIASNSSPDFSFDINTMTIGTQYFICPVVGNDDGSGCVDLSDPCLSIGGCAQVTFRSIPTALLIAGDDICEGTIGNLTVEFTGSGPWDFEYQDINSATVNSLQATNSPFTFDVSPSMTTDYTLISMSGKFCTGTVDGTAAVSVNEAPQATVLSLDCNPTSTAYTVTFEITGGDATSYDVIPANGVLNGNVFTSNPYADGDQFSFEIDDQYLCGPALLEGSFICNCITDAGVMPTDLLSYCPGDMIEGGVTVDSTLDADDNLFYVLHTGSGNILGTIIATNDEPIFDFDPTMMSTGVTYYVSAVAGNGFPNGDVDLNDFCLSVAPGTPILFNEPPTVSISGTTTICDGENTDITIDIAGGVGPFSVIYELDTVQQTSPPIGNSGVSVLETTDQASTYTLVSIEDLGTGCMNTADGTVEVQVSLNVEAGSPYDAFEICDNVNFTISLFENLVGFEYGGVWTDASGTEYPNGGLNTTPLTPGTYSYTYTIDAQAPCPDDMSAVDVIIHPAPVADAGEDIGLDCNLTTTQLGGSGTTPGIFYSWTGDDVSDPSIPNPTISGAGEYILTVTTPFDCVDTDTAYAFISDGTPNAVITVSDISCFGLGDGFMTIDNITGGQPPYTCSFNGGPFTSDKSFINLGVGNYSLVVRDAGGCESTRTFNVFEPDEVTVDLETSLDGTPPIAEYQSPFSINITSSPPYSELDTVIWTTSNPFSDSLCTYCDSNMVSLEFQTTFSVMVSDEGCQDEDRLTVFVNRDHVLYVPNAFSPNGRDDDRNEVFKMFAPDDTNIEEVKSFIVFNRWGEIVYETYNFLWEDGPIDGWWDGTHRGQMMNPAVFTWTAEVEFEDEVVRFYKGDVSLIR